MKIRSILTAFPSSGMRTTAAIFTVSDFELVREEALSTPNKKINNKTDGYIIASFFILIQ
ncbi:MAG: hypothetical protein ACW963_06160 [Candidatus Sifarchaeia archaeon]